MTFINDISLTPSEALQPFLSFRDAELKRRNLFMAESPNVVERALQTGVAPAAVLCGKSRVEWCRHHLDVYDDEIPVYVGEEKELASITGFSLTRGLLCLMRRPADRQASDVLKNGRRLCVIYDVCDAVNVGLIFRTAAALAYDGVILSPGTCDPLNRRSLRTSMGAVFQIPWAYAEGITSLLKQYGFESVCTALSSDSVSLEKFSAEPGSRYAVIFGSEGYGLPQEVIASCNHTVKIPMQPGVDSLNVGAAAAIVLWHFSPLNP